MTVYDLDDFVGIEMVSRLHLAKHTIVHFDRELIQLWVAAHRFEYASVFAVY